jgi:hypothetical protein
VSWFLSLLLTIAVMFFVIRRAKSRRQWSWPAFFWILLLIVLYSAFCGLFAFFVVDWALSYDPAIGALLILAPIWAGAIPVGVIVKRIHRHYVGGTY